jgi:hypothetical protein
MTDFRCAGEVFQPWRLMIRSKYSSSVRRAQHKSSSNPASLRWQLAATEGWQDRAPRDAQLFCQRPLDAKETGDEDFGEVKDDGPYLAHETLSLPPGGTPLCLESIPPLRLLLACFSQ